MEPLPNGGFENGESGWTFDDGADVMADPLAAHGGSRAAVIGRGPRNYVAIAQTVTLRGDQHIISDTGRFGKTVVAVTR